MAVTAAGLIPGATTRSHAAPSAPQSRNGKRLLDHLDSANKDANPDVNGTLTQELLWAGLRGGDPEIVRMALARVDWPRDHPDWFGKLWSPLPGYQPRSAADQALFLECFRLVLERCDPNVRHPRFGRTVLHDVAASDEAVSSSSGKSSGSRCTSPWSARSAFFRS